MNRVKEWKAATDREVLDVPLPRASTRHPFSGVSDRSSWGGELLSWRVGRQDSIDGRCENQIDSKYEDADESSRQFKPTRAS